MNEDKNAGLPLTQAEKEAMMEAGHIFPCPAEAEVIIDLDFVSIPCSRYDELLRAENWVDVIHRFYGTHEASYQMTDLLEALFGPREDGGNA